MSEYDDSHMLSKILERMAAQSLHLKDKIDSGLEIPSWAEYKLYNAYSGLGSALGTAYPGTYGEAKVAATALDLGIAGSALGAGIGALADEDSRLRGAAIGGGVGAVALPGAVLGGLVGMEKLKRMRRAAKVRMRKQAASTESQLLQALSAEGGAAGMKALRKRVKEDDLEQALKALISSGKVRRHPDGDLIKESAAGRLPHEDEGDYAERMLHESGDIVSRRHATREQMKHFPSTEKDTRPLLFRLRFPHQKQAAATATKTDPAKWEAAKREAKSKMGGKHSARAMQLATQIYKKKGGGYSGAKPTSQNNSLKKWGKQKWQWSGGDKPGQGGRGVYLPKKKQDRLKDSKAGRKLLARAAKKKSEATREGRQYSSHGLASGTSLRSRK